MLLKMGRLVLLTGKQTSWVTVVTRADRAKSDRNHCVIEFVVTFLYHCFVLLAILLQVV